MTTASVPKALYQANIDLALRIAALLQENGKQWFDLFSDEAGMRLEQGLSHADRFRRDFSLDKLATLPSDLSEHFLNLDAERWQALLNQAMGHQSRFSEGVQSALDAWKDACATALEQGKSDTSGLGAGALAAIPGLEEVFSSFQRMVGGLGLGSVPFAKSPRAPAAARKPDATADSPAKKPAAATAKKADAAAPKPAATKAPSKPATSSRQTAKPSVKPVAKAAVKAPAKKASAKAPARRASKKASTAAPVPPPSPMPALVTTPRKRA